MRKPPKGFYLSYSRINLYFHNPQQYFMQYVLGHKPEPTRKMLFGTIGHAAIADPKYDWRTALRKERFMSSDERVMEKILKTLPRTKQNEVELTVKWNGITLYSIVDGIDKLAFRERKFAGSGAWNAQRVADNLQIKFYWWLLKQSGYTPKRGWLDHANTSSGRVESYPVAISKNDLDGIENIIDHCYRGIQAEDWGSV